MLIRVPKAEDLAPKPISEGVYRATVTGYKTTISSNNNPQINLELTLNSQGPNPTEKTVGRKVFDNLTVTEEALWRVNDAYKNLTGKDLPEGEISIDELINIVTSNVVNKSVGIRIVNEKYEGKVRSKIKEYQPLN